MHGTAPVCRQMSRHCLITDLNTSSIGIKLVVHLMGHQEILHMADAERDPRTYAIIGAAMEVHRRLGHGFLEAVYQEALEIEFAHRGIPARREVRLTISYGDELLKTPYEADFLCYEDIVGELKAASDLDSSDLAQTINYLKATGSTVGLLLNFGRPRLQYRRVVFSGQTSQVWDENAVL
jgi:GxxExxY protein